MVVMLLFLQLPEITRDADESVRSKYLSLVLDVIGLSIGVVIMTLIAFYEHRIRSLLDYKWRHAGTCHDIIVPLESEQPNCSWDYTPVLGYLLSADNDVNHLAVKIVSYSMKVKFWSRSCVVLHQSCDLSREYLTNINKHTWWWLTV